MELDARVYVAGHHGLVGSAILRRLQTLGYHNLITRTHQDLDLTQMGSVRDFFELERPEYVFLAAAKVGGIHANRSYPAEFIYENLMVQCNVMDAAFRTGVERLLFLGSSCIYPRDCPQPIREEYLLTGPLEQTNDAYAVAKIAGIKLCEAYNRQYGTQFLAVMPTNLYGPNDNFHLQNSHVIPALLRKTHEAKLGGAPALEVWGSGRPLREFLHVDDMADASVFLLARPGDVTDGMPPGPPMINVGSGSDVSIADLTHQICDIVGYEGELRFDHAMPDGTPRKCLDVSRLSDLGWRPKIELRDGLGSTYEWFLQHQDSYRS
jgi:GDP-L-fucose synthase